MKDKVNILFLEDFKEYQEYIRLFIKSKKAPINPVFVEDGETAMEYLLQCTEENFPSIICVDFNLPNMTGVDFGNLFNKHFSEKYPNSILLLTTHLSITHFSEIITDGTTLAPFQKEILFKPLNSKSYQLKIAPIIEKIIELDSAA